MENQSLVSSTLEKLNYDITNHNKQQTENPYKTEINSNKSIASSTDLLSYSSSDSSDENSPNSKSTQITHLRPSSTIYPNTNSQNQTRNAPKLNQEWKNLFKTASRIKTTLNQTTKTRNNTSTHKQKYKSDTANRNKSSNSLELQQRVGPIHGIGSITAPTIQHNTH
jgi:hypothetical protein